MGGYPIAMRVLPGDRYAVVTDDAEDDQALRVVDLHAADPLHAVIVRGRRIRSATATATRPGCFYGLALTKAGTRLYVSNGGYDPAADSVAAVDALQHGRRSSTRRRRRAARRR